jgi:hypothetical protein
MHTARIDWARDYSGLRVADLLALDDLTLAAFDPLAINLIVAREISSLADLDIPDYQSIVNSWTDDFRHRYLPRWETCFHEAPEDFQNDINFFRLGMICQYLDLVVRVKYKPELRDAKQVSYIDPSDLFLNGLIDTREGTCGNMSALHVAIGWRMSWPVSLACVGSHFICRYDDGQTQYNIEATQTGDGGWSSRTDDRYAAEEDLPPLALECGSDLRAVRPREMLGAFVGLRARHLQDLAKHCGERSMFYDAERDWLLARHLFPTNRSLFKQSFYSNLLRGGDLFETNEPNHPINFGAWAQELWAAAPSPSQTTYEDVADHAILAITESLLGR